jgi:hypothetical protein
LKICFSNQGWAKVFFVMVLTLLCTAGTFATAPTRSVHAASSAQSCQIVLDPLRPGETTSRIVSHHCSQNAEDLHPLACQTLLMRWWSDVGYAGDHTDVCDNNGNGPCDSYGYGINYVGDDWNDRISSYQVFNNCIWARASLNINYGGECWSYHGDTVWVGAGGAEFNDAISSFRIASQEYHC